jgi:hypothetical protein
MLWWRPVYHSSFEKLKIYADFLASIGCTKINHQSKNKLMEVE